MTECPLCLGGESSLFCSSKVTRERIDDYWRCPSCDLVFRDPLKLPDQKFEKEHYGKHENTASNEGYRNFLHQIVAPVTSELESGARGLDFGCGPGTDRVLASLFQDAGFEMSTWDPIFDNDPAKLGYTYDFVISTEVIEHFHRPEKSWQDMLALVRPGGVLGVQTSFSDEYLEPGRFKEWWYPRDPTHVSFYSKKTFKWMSAWRNLELVCAKNPVAVFRTSSRGESG